MEQNAKKLEERIQRLKEAFIYEKAIDAETYHGEKHKLEEELALVEMELRDAKANECDIEGVLTFATYVIANAARLWTEFPLEQKQRFQQILFPEGVTFDGEKFETTVTCPIFKVSSPSEARKSHLATLTGFEPVLPP